MTENLQIFYGGDDVLLRRVAIPLCTMQSQWLVACCKPVYMIFVLTVTNDISRWLVARAWKPYLSNSKRIRDRARVVTKNASREFLAAALSSCFYFRHGEIGTSELHPRFSHDMSELRPRVLNAVSELRRGYFEYHF